MNKNTVLWWSQGLWLCSPSPGWSPTVSETSWSEWEERLSQSSTYQLPPHSHSGVRGGTWGHNCSLLLAARGGVWALTLESGLALALLWAKECGGGSDDVRLPSLSVNRPCKLLLSCPGPWDHQTRMKGLRRQRPSAPRSSSCLQRRPLPAPISP